MTKQEFINLCIEFIENKDYLVIDKCLDFQQNILNVIKSENSDKFAFGITFMEQIIEFRHIPKNYRELLESF